MDGNHLCGVGIFSTRWLALSFSVCESLRGRILEEPARDSGEALDVLGMANIPAFTAWLGDG